MFNISCFVLCFLGRFLYGKDVRLFMCCVYWLLQNWSEKGFACLIMDTVGLTSDSVTTFTSVTLICCLLYTYTHTWWFLSGRDVPLFMWCVCCVLWLLTMLSEMVDGLLEIDFVCFTSGSLTTIFCWNRNMCLAQNSKDRLIFVLKNERRNIWHMKCQTLSFYF